MGELSREPISRGVDPSAARNPGFDAAAPVQRLASGNGRRPLATPPPRVTIPVGPAPAVASPSPVPRRRPPPAPPGADAAPVNPSPARAR